MLTVDEVKSIVAEISESVELNTDIMDKLKVIVDDYAGMGDDTALTDMTNKYNDLKKDYIDRFFGGGGSANLQSDEEYEEEKEEPQKEEVGEDVTIDDLFTNDNEKGKDD